MIHTYIIAEAGVNHNGSLVIAKKLIDEAKRVGADAVKFQTFKADALVTRDATKAEYQKKTTSADESQYEMIKRLELSVEDHVAMIEHCQTLGIDFLSSPFDVDSVDLLSRLGLKTLKIPSGEITNLPLLRKVGELKGKVILSTGMADLGEIEEAYDVLTSSGTKVEDITILHCNTEYPTPFEDVNLSAMLTIRTAFGTKVGYSDHTNGIEVPVAAVALGACLIEKHFTLDRNMHGPDHKASLQPEEFRSMVTAIRNIEKAIGTGVKRPTESERKNIVVARKSIVAVRLIKSGEKLSENNLGLKRPGNGIAPRHYSEVLGKIARRNLHEGDQLSWKDFE